MYSRTYGEVTIQEIANILRSFVKKHGEQNLYKITIGTDSQNFDKTKVVVVIAAHCVGHGGIFFYQVQKVPRIDNVKQKITYETTQSLEVAQSLLDALDELRDAEGWNYEKYLSFAIHVDAGKDGKSSVTIPSITAWVRACGWDVETKPNSYAASTIANRISK